MTSRLLRSDQVRGALRLVDEAREMAEHEARQRHLVEGIARLVGAPFVTAVLDVDFGPGRRGQVVDHRASFVDASVERMFDSMRRHGSGYNPGARALMERVARRRGGEMVTHARRELIADGAWYKHEFVAEHQRGCGLDDFVYSAHVLGGTRIHALTVTRAVRDRPFDDEDRNLVDLFHEQYLKVALPRAAREPKGPRLTPRERAVLRGLLRGATEKAVALDLGITRETVHSYVKTIYAAYGVSSRAELLVRCLGG